MPIKEKLLGLILIIIGALPFLLKIGAIENFFSKYKFLSYLVPGEIIYRIILILIGVFLIWKIKPRIETRY